MKKKRKNAPKNSAVPLGSPKDAMTLIDAGYPEEAREILQSINIESLETNEQIEAFMHCAMMLEDWSSLDALHQLMPQQPATIYFKGVSEVMREHYRAAEEYLNVAQSGAREAFRLFWLSEAIGERKQLYAIKDPETKNRCIALLETAVTLDGCPYQAFDRLQSFYGHESIQKTHDLLVLGLSTCRDVDRVRFRLAEVILYRSEEVETDYSVMDLLKPLLTDSNKARFLAFEYLFRKEDFENALYHVERIPPTAFDEPSKRQALIGLCLLKDQKLDEAREFVTASLSQAETDYDKGILQVVLAGVDKGLQAIDSALTHLEQALAHLLDSLEDGPFPFRVDDHVVSFDLLDELHLLCAWAADLKQLHKAQWKALKAMLLFYRYKTDLAYDEKINSWEKNDKLLLQAYKAAPLPLFYFDMAEYWSGYTNSRDLELEFRMRDALYKCKTQPWSDEWKPQSEINLEENEAITKDTARKAVSFAKSFIKSNIGESENEVRQIVPVLCENAILPILDRAKSYDEIVDLGIFLREHSLYPSAALFKLAYAAQTIGRDELAENIYVEYLSSVPEDSAALFNLSLISEKRQDLSRAVEQMRKAIQSPGAGPAFHQRLETLEKQIQRQDDFLKAARHKWGQLDLYKRRILALLSDISGFDSLEHLGELAGIEEKYMAGHWRKLVEMGFIIDNNSTYKVNPHISDLLRNEK